MLVCTKSIQALPLVAHTGRCVVRPLRRDWSPETPSVAASYCTIPYTPSGANIHAESAGAAVCGRGAAITKCLKISFLYTLNASQVPAYTLNQPERQYVDVARRYPNATLPLDFVKHVCSWMQVAFV